MIHDSDGQSSNGSTNEELEKWERRALNESSILNQSDVDESDTKDSDYYGPEQISLTGETQRKSLKFQNNDYTVPLYHPVEHTSKSNLLIEVSNDQVLKGVIICDLEFVCDNIPVIASKYKTTNGKTFRLEEKSGKSVYSLDCEYEPKLVCEFIASLYEESVEIRQDNAIGLYFLADFWRVEFLLEHIVEYIERNMSNALLVDAYNYSKFYIFCDNFIEMDPDFKPDLLFRTIQKLNENGFIVMVDAMVNRIESNIFVRLILKWLRENRNENNYKTVIFEIDFDFVERVDRDYFYLKILKRIPNNKIRKFAKHLFGNGKNRLDNKPKEDMRFLDSIEPDECVCSGLVDVLKKTPDEDKHCKIVEELRRRSYIKYKKFCQHNLVNSIYTEVSCLDSTKLTDSVEDIARIRNYIVGYSIPLDRNIDVFSWRLKLEQYDDNGRIDIGISEKETENQPFYIYGGYHWGIRRTSEHDPSNKNSSFFRNILFQKKVSGVRYGAHILKTNDIMEVKYHQKDNKLEFFINEVSQGIAFDNIPKGNYGLIVSMKYTKSKITLLK